MNGISIIQMPLSKITIDPARFQARSNDVDEHHVRKLVKTWDMRKCSPLLVWRNNDTHYLLSGHHRHAAASQLKIESLPVQVLDCPESEAVEIAVTDNFGRLPYSEVELSGILAQYVESGMKWDEISARVGRSGSYCRDVYGLHHASGLIRERVQTGTLEWKFGAAIGKAAHDYKLQEEQQNDFLTSCIDSRDMTITELKAALKRYAPMLEQSDLFGVEMLMDRDGNERKEMEKLLRECNRGIKAIETLEKYGAKITTEMRRAVNSLKERAREYSHDLHRFECRIMGMDDPGPYKRNNRAQAESVVAA